MFRWTVNDDYLHLLVLYWCGKVRIVEPITARVSYSQLPQILRKEMETTSVTMLLIEVEHYFMYLKFQSYELGSAC